MQAAAHTPHKETWHPISEEDHALVRSALEEILSTAPFRSSRRYPAMLRYIVEQTLQGNQDKLKERIIGIEVFGREPGYDTGEDPVVRFSAGEIRKRLAQFYREKGSAGRVELHLPLGSYVPEFYLNIGSPDVVLPRIEPSQPQFTLEKVTETVPQVEQKRRLPIVFLTSVLALALIALIWTIARRSHAENQALNVWSPLLDNPNTVLISTGRPVTPPNEELEPPNLTIKDHFRRPGFRVSITAADAIANIAGFLQQQKKPFRIHDAASNTLSDLHGRPVVLVNGGDNKWTLLLLKPTRFNFVSEGDFSYIQDSKNLGFHDWNVDFTQSFHKQTTDYAIVGRFNSATTGGPVMVVAGISSNGTEAAGEFIVSPERLSELLRSAPLGWKNGNFEAVLKVEVVDGSTGASSIIASEFW